MVIRTYGNCYAWSNNHARLFYYYVNSSKFKIFGAGYLAAIYLSEKSPPQGKVFLCGNDAIADELKMAGVDFFGHGPGIYY